jgi:hypothetical protein
MNMLYFFYPDNIVNLIITMGDLLGIVILGAYIAKHTPIWLGAPLIVLMSPAWLLIWDYLCLRFFSSENIWRFLCSGHF